MSNTLIKWWTLFVGTLVASALVGMMGVYSQIVSHQATLYFAVSILSYYVVVSAKIGQNIYSKKTDYEPYWMLSEQTMSLGLIGTGVGLIIVFNAFFGNFDLQNVEKSKQLMATVSSGCSTALYTMVLGCTYSLLLKFQVLMAEVGIEEEMNTETRELISQFGLGNEK